MTQPWHEPGFLEQEEKRTSLEIGRQNIELVKKQTKAISEIVKVIYFSDSADYLTGLWAALSALDHEAALILEQDGKEAFDKYAKT